MLTLKGVTATVLSAGLLRGRRSEAVCAASSPSCGPAARHSGARRKSESVSERGRQVRGGCAVLIRQRVMAARGEHRSSPRGLPPPASPGRASTRAAQWPSLDLVARPAGLGRWS